MHHQHDKAVNSQALASCNVYGDNAKLDNFSDGQSIDDSIEDSCLWQDDYAVDDDDDYD